MELYKIESIDTSDKYYYKYGALLIIVLFALWEIYQSSAGRISLLGWAYCIIFLGLWIWRFTFSYTYILTDKEFIVLSHGLGFTRRYAALLQNTESYTDKYVKSFFKKTKLRHYVHRYASHDTNPMRLIVFKNAKSIEGVMFKADDKFIKKLRKMMPDKFLHLE